MHVPESDSGPPPDELEPVKVAVSPVEKFREYLKTKNKRTTTERVTIVEEVFSQHEHFDADELISRLTARKDGTRVSRSSVYRTLVELENAGMIRKVARHNDREVYEHDYGYPQHDHLVCDKCQKLIEFQNEEIAKILEEIAVQHGFRKTGHRLEVFGMCRECARPKRRRHQALDRV